ncbi:MAG: T9SS type A sorting domain-containing protein, partial [bacterium]
LILGLPSKMDLRLSLYDVLGRNVASIFHGVMDAGWHVIELNRNVLSRLRSGVYFVRLENNGDSVVTKVVIAR